VVEEVLAAAGLDHRGLAAVGVDLVDHVILERTGDLCVGAGRAPATTSLCFNASISRASASMGSLYTNSLRPSAAIRRLASRVGASME
jgi:hypothetical protein